MARHKEFDPAERLNRARNLFWKKGYHATSMQDLVTATKLHRGSLYDTYGDKHQLFMESLTSYATETHAAYKDATTGIKSPLKAIKAMIQKAISRSFDEEKVCMSVKSSFELAPFYEDVQRELQIQVKSLALAFEKLIIKGQQAGEIDKKKNAKQLALFIVGSFAGFWQMQNLFNDKKMATEMSEVLMQSLK
ncbi:TetR/AcrR family transcriptional regulator [Mucilaginibacter sp. X4EP1]|uniref:TetR/AcrR family transcriptional regulator n=1 Tax=Mucilaginibacter sp. X4EP1 TaxID=2723092 RepID=UPI00216A423D|nr:TetR/AcrR family transcriptional regulator [Mucilaginibacter sp. X4EP1]MCS3811528.1 TetR/AcrR family transcriptional repressor of nem operon [Mucilaginibacter sp. X4EP1]